jgi:hypothetical protein
MEMFVASMSAKTIQEGMNRRSKSVIEIPLKHSKFITIKGQKALTSSRAPSRCLPVGQHAINH